MQGFKAKTRGALGFFRATPFLFSSVCQHQEDAETSLFCPLTLILLMSFQHLYLKQRVYLVTRVCYMHAVT
jgi:hypothetical protein